MSTLTEQTMETPVLRPVWREASLWLACALGVLVIAAVAGVAPALPDLAKGLDVRPASLGFVISAFMLPGLVVAPLAGILADRRGRLAVLAPSLGLIGVFGAACALVDGLGPLLAFRLCAGCGAGGVSVVSLSILGGRFKGKRLAGATAVFAFTQTLATAALPFVGGAMAEWSWRAPFLLSLFALPLLPLAWRLLGDADRPAASKTAGLFAGAKAAAKAVDWRLGAVFVLEFLNFALLTGALLTYAPLLLRSHLGAGPAEIGMVMAFAAGISSLAALATKPLSRVLAPHRIAALGFASYIPAYVMAPMAGTMSCFLMAAALLGLGRGLNLPTLVRMVNEKAPDERRGLVNACYLFVLRVGQTSGPLLAGLVVAFFSLEAVFYVDAVVSGAASAFALYLLPVLSRNRDG